MSELVEGYLERLNAKPVTDSNSVASLQSSPIIYSNDGRYLFQREAHVIHIRHTKTGQILHQCVRTRTQKEDGDLVTSDAYSSYCDLATVTCIALSPLYSLQLLASYEDGCIVVWDVTEERILKTYNVGASILWMGSNHHSPNVLTILLSKSQTSYSLVEYDLLRHKQCKIYLDLENAEAPIVTCQSSFGSDEPIGQWVVLAIAQTIHIFHVSPSKITHNKKEFVSNVHTLKLQHMNSITSLAVHTTNGSAKIAVGDSRGKIVLYRVCLEQDKNGDPKIAMPLQTTMHWHAHRVHCLAFGANGTFLLSGGEECVLVFWQLTSGRRNFLPRRSAAIMAIAPRNDYKQIYQGVIPTAGYSVFLRDNVLFQYNSVTREQEWQVFGLARSGGRAAWTLPNSHWEENKQTIATPQLVYDPETKAIPFNGRSSVGIIQFYHPFQQRILQNLHLTERNPVLRTEEEDDICCTMARQWQFSPCGHFFVTLQSDLVITHDEAKICQELQQAIRFYNRREDGSFYLHTAIDAPHSSNRITCLAYSPSLNRQLRNFLASADDKGEFRIWSLFRSDQTSSSVWRCRAVIRHRPMPIKALKFSADGSLLAVSYGNTLTMWNIETNVLSSVLTTADGKEIIEVYFANLDCPYIAIKTSGEVEIWNLLTLNMEWRYVFPADNALAWICVHPSKPEFSLCLTRESVDGYVIMQFSFTSVVLKRSIHFSVPENQTLWTFHYGPNGEDGKECYLLMDAASNVWCLSTSSPPESPQNSQADTQSATRTENKMHGILPIHKSSPEKMPNSKLPIARSNTNSFEDLFNVPTHLLPPVSYLYQPFMNSLLTKRHHSEVPKTQNSLSPKQKQVKSDEYAMTEKRKESFDSSRWIKFVEEELQARTKSTCISAAMLPNRAVGSNIHSARTEDLSMSFEDGGNVVDFLEEEYYQDAQEFAQFGYSSKKLEQLHIRNLATREKHKAWMDSNERLKRLQKARYRRQQVERWEAKTVKSPFLVNLAAENERLDEENRVQAMEASRKKRELEQRTFKATNEISERRVEPSEIEILRREKRILLEEEKRLKTLLALEKTNRYRKTTLRSAGPSQS